MIPVKRKKKYQSFKGKNLHLYGSQIVWQHKILDYDCAYHFLPPTMINCGNAYSMSNCVENCPKSRRKVRLRMAGVSRESDSLWSVLLFVETKTSAPNVQQSLEMNPSEWRWKVWRGRNFAKPTSVPLSNRLNAPALSVQTSTHKFKVSWVQILFAISIYCQLILSGLVSKRAIYTSLSLTITCSHVAQNMFFN